MMDTRRFITANIKLIKTHPLQLYCSALVFSPSGSQIRSFFDKEAPDNMKVYPAMEKGWNACLAQFDSDFPPLKAAWSPDSRRSVVGTEGNTVEVWSCKTGTCLRVLKGHFGPVWAVAFAPNNIHVASGSDDGTVKIWNADTGACLHTFTYFERTNSSDTPFSVWSVAFSPDGSRIAAGSSQGDIRIWDTFDSKSLISITTSHSDTELVMFTSNGKRILANSDSYYTQIWDADSGEFLESIGTEAEDVSDVTFSPGGHYIARGMDSGSIEIWSSDSKEHSVIRPEGAYHFGGGTQISSDGTRIATQWGSNMLIWDANRGVLLKVFDGQQGHQEILMGFSPDGKTVMTISTVVRIWDINGSMATKGLEDAHDNVSLLIPSPDNLLLASALKNSGVIYLWDVETGICQQTLRGHTGIPTVLAFSPDSSHLASSSRDGIIMIWRLESSSSVCTRTLKAHSNPTVSISFSPDGHNLASGDSKGTIKIFEVDSGTCAQEIAAEGLWVDSVAYSPDGRYLVSALKTGKVSVWDVDTGSAQMSFWSQACPSDSVSVSPGRVSFSSDSQHIVFGGYGTWVTIWHVDGTHVRTLKPQTSSNLNPITPYILDPNMPDHYEYDVDKEGWVIWRGARMLWLPITFRSFQLAVVSDTLAIAGSRGKILFLKFSD
jgi:WD40 repeat protein